ncbi:MAG: hypothetical protein RQ743_08980 [Bacteroidales bacterium]|nr:hypothetical protein [Bacteroidales bacterium]
MKHALKIPLLLIAIIILVSCGGDHYTIREKLTEPDIEILRLERDLFSGDPAALRMREDSLRLKYGSFLRLFAYVINAGTLEDSTAFERLIEFTTDRFNYEVYVSVMEKYPELSYYEKEFERAWANYSYYFPDSVIPRMYTFISGFNNSVIVGDSVLATGLDRYLGAGHDYYTRLGIYNYITLKMIPEKIVPDAIYAWAKAGNPYSAAGSSEDVISRMLYEGKLHYFTKCMLNEYPDSLLFGFTSGQMRFCLNNEDKMWEYLIEHDMLFSTDLMLIRKLTGEAPFTTYFTSESPGRAGVWLGFRIIESYMKNNEKVELGDLMQNNNYRKILEEARYSPSK